MQNFVRLTAAFALFSSLSACSQSEEPDQVSPETQKTSTAECYSGGPIYTAIDAIPMVDAVKVENGKITYTGAESEDWCEDGKSVDLNGAAMFPGFTDAHGHFIGIGLREMTLNLEGTSSICLLYTSDAADD